MAKTTVTVNQKGSVGKTTTCVNLTVALKSQGCRVLVCDFDLQASTTSGLGVDKTISSSIYDMLLNGTETARATSSTSYGDVLSSNKALAGATIEMIALEQWGYRLKNALEQVAEYYDYIFINCPPSLELLTPNVLCMADTVLVPVQCEYYALEGLSDLLPTIHIVRRSFNPKITLERVVFTMYDGRTNFSMQVAEEVKRRFPGQAYATVIPHNTRLSKAPSFGKSVSVCDALSRGVEAYDVLTQELLERNQYAVACVERRDWPMTLECSLGKGLDALLGDAIPQSQEGGSPSLLTSQVEPRLEQPRKQFDEESPQDLVDSIHIHGIVQSLTARRLSSDYYQIIAGERRWQAARLTGLSEIPAVIIRADDRKVVELGLIENLQREDLNPIEETSDCEVPMSEYGLTQEEVVQQAGKSHPAVANVLRLLTLPDPVYLLLEGDRFSTGHARTILAMPSGELQKKLAQKTTAEELSVRQTEALAKRLTAKPREIAESKSAAGLDLSICLRKTEKTLAIRFGRKVHTISGRKKGKIELEYYNPEDLNTLLELLEQLPSAGKKGVSP